MAKATVDDKVKVKYTGMLLDGTVFDDSKKGGPLEFKIGEKKLLPDFEDAVIGMEPGETKEIEIPAEKGYGKYNPDWIMEIKREDFPEHIIPENGQMLQFEHESGNVVNVVVTMVNDDLVAVDANHPLAGKDLKFSIELLEIA